MTAVRPWAEVVADLRRGHAPFTSDAALRAEAAALGDAAQAVIAEVRAALDQYDKDVKTMEYGAPTKCVWAVAKAVRP